MVRWALARARRIVPDDRILVVVNETHRRHWEAELTDVPRNNLLVQPRNRGTAAGVLLALLTVQVRSDAQAPVLFLPSDHDVANEGVFQNAALAALRSAIRGDAGVFLLGMAPTPGDRDCGWILPADSSPATFVYRFFEKPPAETVRHLLDRGGLVNTLVFAARAQTLVGLFIDTLPSFARSFLVHRRFPGGVTDLHRLYDTIGTTDLSRAVFQQSPHLLSVVRVPDCGWVDLGTPERLLAFLNRHSTAHAVAARRATRVVAAA